MSLMSDSLLEKIGNTSRVSDMFPDPVEQKPEDNILEAAYHGLLSATGNMIHTANDAIAMAGKPKMYSDQEWMENQTDLSKWISQAGRDLEQAHERNYEPWSANRIVSGVAGVVPYALGLGAAGAAAARTGNYQAIGNTAWQAATRLGLSPRTAEIASQVAPAAVFGPAIKAPESLIEGQGAYDEYIEEAKRNGTYIPNVTEVQARKLADDVARDNMALLMGTGSAEELLLSQVPGGYTAKNIAQKLLGGMGVNAAEEMAQQIFPKAEGGKDWNLTDEDVLEAGLIGAISGGAMQGAGIGMNWLADRGRGNNEQEPEQTTDVFDTGHGDIDRIVSDAARRYDLSPELIHKVIQQESGYNPEAVSDAGAQGLMQLMPGTAQGLGVSDSFDPEQNINGGAKYLRQMLDEFDGDVRKALAAYNAGPNNIEAGYGYADEVLGRSVDGTEQASEGNRGWNPVEAASDFFGKRMDNGENGCVEAVTKIGAAGGNPFLADQLEKGVVYVPTLVENAGDMVIPFDASKLQAGDVIVYGDDDHVVIYDGNGGYVGNSSSQMKVIHGDDYTAMGEDLPPTKIIKTGGQGGSAPIQQSASQMGASSSRQQKPVDTYDNEVNSIYEGFIREQLKASQSQEDKDFFGGFFDKDGNFEATKENIAKIEDRINDDLAEDFDKYVEAQETAGTGKKPQPSKPEQTQIDVNTESIGRLRELLTDEKDKAANNGDSDTVFNISKTLATGNEQAIRQLAGKLLPVTQPESVIQKQPQTAPQVQPQQVTSPQEQTPTPQVQQQATQDNQQEQPEQPIQNQQGEIQQTQPQGTPVRQAQDNSTQNQVQPQSTAVQQQPISQQPQPIQTQPTMEQRDAKIIQDAYSTGMGAIPTSKKERVKQGSGLAMVARTAGISLPSGMVDSLRNGNKNAILQAQDIIRNSGVTPAFGGTMPLSRQALSNVIGGEENESTESTKTESKETGNTNNKNQNAKPEQAEKAQVGEAQALKQFKKNAAKVVSDYRKDKISYDDAFTKIVNMAYKATQAAQDAATAEAIKDEALKAVGELNNILEEKQVQEGDTQNVASEATQKDAQQETPKEEQKTTSQNGTETAKEDTRNETSSEEGKTPQNEPQEAREAKALSEFKKNATKVVSGYRSDNVEKYISERHKDNADEIRKKLYEETTLWDDETQSHKRTAMAQFLEDFAKTPGARVYYKPPKKIDGVNVAGDMGEYVYQNDKMKADDYEPTLNPIYYDYAKYLLGSNKEKLAQSEGAKSAQKQGEQTQAKPTTAENSTAKEIKGITFTFGEKIKESQYETVYTVEMDTKPSSEATKRILKGTHGRWSGGKTLKFNSLEAANNFLTQMENDFGAKAIKQADKYNGFLKSMTPAAQARADKTLSKTERYNGKISSRGKIVEGIIESGGHAESRGNTYRIYTAKGTFVEVTKIEHDYARFLEGLRTSDTQEETETDTNQTGKGQESKPNKETGDTTKEYKYYMNERGVSPGAQPKGFTRFDEEDKGGRYGAIYYDHPLTEKEIADYELTSANQDESQEKANEKHHREKPAQNEGNKKAADEGGKRLSSASSVPQNQKTSNQKPTGKHSETRGAFSVVHDSGKHLAKLESKAQKNLIEELSTLTKNMGGTANKEKKTFTFKDIEALNQFLDCANAYMSITDPETMAKLSITAWHGSPHKFDSFSLQSIGTGEGSQVHGWGLYFAGERKTSEKYRLMLNGGITHGVRIDGKVYHRKELEDEPVWLDEEGNDVWDYDTMFADFYAFNEYDKEKTIEAIEQYRKQANTKNADAFADKMLSYFDEHEVEAATPGTLFQVEIPDEDVLLDEQDNYEDQSDFVKKALRNIADELLEIKYSDRQGAGKNISIKTLSKLKNPEKNAYLHGREIYRLLSESVGGDKAASELLNKHGIRGITYYGERDGLCYVVFDDQAIDIIGKFSANDEIRKILDGIKIVENEELNSQQEKFSALGSELGCQIVWIDADPRLNGMHIPGTNVTLLNRKAGMSLQKTFWHETFHWIKANNDPLWEELLTYFKGKTAFTKEQIDSYREKYGRYDLQRDEDVIEELLADAFVDVKQRVPLMQEMAKENPSLAKKFVAWLKRMMDRFVEVFHNPEGKLTTAQRDQFVEAFGRLAASMVDGNKKKLFKTYNNGKRITFLDGEPLPELQFSRRSRFSAFDVDFDEIKDVRKKYEGTGQWMKAPNGKKTNLTEAQWLAVRTKAFKKWFGDWENNPDSASKIIDENGEPMPVAHGTNESFSRFDKGKVGSNTGNYGHLGYGFYFSTDVDEASGYGNNTMSLFLNIRKPFEGDEQSLEKYSDILDLGETDTVLDRDSIKKALKQKSSIAYQFVKNLEKSGYEEAWERAWDNEEVQHDEELQEFLDDVARYWDRAGSETYTEEDIERISKVFGKNITSHKRLHISPLPYLLNTGAYKDQTEAFTKALQTDGYDGVIYGSEIVAFEPKQIKSATDNVGTFSTESDNIKYSFAGENAENAPFEDLERAKKMDGKSSPTEIYKKTGWFKGQDGKWRFEIPDNLNKINFDRLEKSKAGSMYYTLGEIYDNPKLYEAYPDLIRVLVGKEEGMGTVNGQVRYDEGEPIIVLNADKLNQPSMKTTLIHEIQHVIQQKEGFAAGGSPESVRYQIRERVHDILKKLRKLDNANELIGRYQAMNKAFFDYIENPDVDKEMEMRRESDRLADEYELFAATLPKKLSEEVVGLWNQKQNLMDALENGSDFELYRNLGGEQEAREVARRSEGATRLSKQNSDTQEAEKALNDALENATENQMKAYRSREKLDKEIRKQGGRPTEEQLEKMESYDKAMGEALSEAYDNYLWERDTADEMKEEMGTPTPHNDDAIIVFNGKEFAMSSENDVDNSENVGDNESRITDKQKDELFRQVSSHLDSYIDGQVAKGKNRDELLKELASEHSSHRERLIGGYRATARDFEARKGDLEHRQAVVEAHWPEAKTWNENREAKIAEAYNLFTDQIKEVVDYAGVLYREIVIDRARASRDSNSGIQLHSWRDAERQRDERESGKSRLHNGTGKNSITKDDKHSSGSASSMPKFSYSSSDNSTPSLMQRIRNTLSGVSNSEQAKTMYRKDMAQMIENALGVKIRFGKMNPPADGSTVIYKENDKVIRSMHAYDWENILPVAGGLIAERLGISNKASDTTPEMRNYIADWILTGAANNTSPEAKQFQKAMAKHPAYADKLIGLRTKFQDWADKTAQEKMRQTVQWSKDKSRSWKERKDLLYEQFIEELAPVENLVKNFEKATGKKLEDIINPMTAFRLFRGSYGRAITMIEGVGDAAVDGLKMNFPGVDFTGFKTLRTILADIGALQNQEKQKDFGTYCIACHILDMHRKNQKNRLEQEKLEYQVAGLKEQIKEDTQKRKDMMKKLALYQGEMSELRKLERRIESNKNKVSEYEKRIESLEESIYETPDDFTEENCKMYIREGKDKYDEAQKALVRFSNVTAAILANSGVISYKHYTDLLKKWPNYVPLFRVFEENENIDFGDSMKKLAGSTRDIVNPIESIIHNTVDFIKKAEKNRAKCLLADLARCEGSGWLIEEVDNSKPNTKTTVTFYENGVRKYLETDPAIVEAINNMDRSNSNIFIKLFHAVTTISRACFTIASPEFAVRNVFRDYADMTVYNKYGFVSPADWIRGLIHAMNRDSTYYEWLSSGAAMASAVSLDRNYTQEMVDKLNRSWGRRFASKQFGKALLEALQKAGEYSEYATRISMYEKAKKATMKNQKADIQAAIVTAALQSRDLMDFSRHGKAGGMWNKFSPFANANLQGMNKFYRTMFDPKQYKNKKELAWAWARLALSSVLPAMVLFLAHHDDDWYKEAPDWLKETHWLFKIGDTVIRIPKGSDVGIRFISNAVEKGMAEAYGEDKYKLLDYFKPIIDALPDIIPALPKPMIEAMLNKSFFTKRNIVPQYQEKLPEKLQYGPYTTGLSKVIGEALGIAPSKIDHVIAGYTGSMGMAIPKAIDLALGTQQLDIAPTELPLTRSITYMPYKNPRSVQKFYELLDEQTKYENEYKMTKKRPEELDSALLERLKATKKHMTKLSKEEKDVINNPNLTLEQRKKRQMDIQQKRINLVKQEVK